MTFKQLELTVLFGSLGIGYIAASVFTDPTVVIQPEVIPLALKIAAGLFLLIHLFAAVGTVAQYLQYRLSKRANQ